MTKYFNVTVGWVAGESLTVDRLCDDAGEPLDESTLVQCIPCRARLPLRYEARKGGRVYDWNWGLFLLPIIRSAIAEQLLEVAGADVELVPLEVPGVEEPMSVVNILSRPDCVDELRSAEVRRFTAADGDPERVGKYKWVGGLIVDPLRVGGANLFRVAGYEIAMVASRRFVDVARRAAWTGIDFAPQHEAPWKAS